MQIFGEVMRNQSERKHSFLNQQASVTSDVDLLFVLTENV
jgi:hypothetical protein